MNRNREFSLQSKYEVVGKHLHQKKGRLLDIGARDRCLAKHLGSTEISYLSADVAPGHDYQVNLEYPLSLPDDEFDFVVALDILEHLENIHQAFSELARITKGTLIVALPNMATLLRRISFLRQGWLHTAKYDLLPRHQGDRHRWLTVYGQIKSFFEENARSAGLEIELVVDEIDFGPKLYRMLGWSFGRMGLPVSGLFVGRCIYFLRKSTVNHG